MNKQNRQALYEKLFFFEHDRHFKLNASIATRASTLALLIGGIAFLAKAIPLTKGYTAPDVILLVLLILCGLAVVVGIYYLAAALWNMGYGFLPKSADFEATHAKYVAWYKQWEPEQDPVIAADDDVAADLLSRLTEAGDLSSQSNNIKSKRLHRATGASVVAIILLGLGFLAYLFNPSIENLASSIGHCEPQLGQSDAGPDQPDNIQMIGLTGEESQVVRLESLIGGAMSIKDESNPATSNRGRQEAAQPTTAPPKPSLPPVRIIKEGGDKSKAK